MTPARGKPRAGSHVQDQLLRDLDDVSSYTPARVVIEFNPVEFFTYSSAELDDAGLSNGFDRWGRRGQNA